MGWQGLLCSFSSIGTTLLLLCFPRWVGLGSCESFARIRIGGHCKFPATGRRRQGLIVPLCQQMHITSGCRFLYHTPSMQWQPNRNKASLLNGKRNFSMRVVGIYNPATTSHRSTAQSIAPNCECCS